MKALSPPQASARVLPTSSTCRAPWISMPRYLLPCSTFSCTSIVDTRHYTSCFHVCDACQAAAPQRYVLCVTLLVSLALGTVLKKGLNSKMTSNECMQDGLQVYSVKYFHQGLVRRQRTTMTRLAEVMKLRHRTVVWLCFLTFHC